MVPIYIQEKIHPQVIIDTLPRTVQTDDDQTNLFADFNGVEDDFEKKVDFYSQKDDRQKPWSNRLILGDSLLVMTSLADKEGLKGKVQTIYLDPPYGIKFGSNWQVSTRKRDVKDGKAQDTPRQPEQVRAFRDTWKLGIHSYLAYLRDRLVVARSLLTETGSVFVQIGDENVHRVRALMDEAFGEENFIRLVAFQKTGGIEGNFLSNTVDYVLWYGRNKIETKYHRLLIERKIGHTSLDRYDQYKNKDLTTRALSKEEKQDDSSINTFSRYQLFPLYSDGESEGARRAFHVFGQQFEIRKGTHWKTTQIGLLRLAMSNRIERTKNTIRYRRFVGDVPMIPITDRWESTQIGTERIYVVQTAREVVQRCILMTTDPGDLVLDPTCGPGTTAYVAEQWGRRWITIDTSRVALALARTRMMAARYPYYLLADSPEGIKKETELTSKGCLNPSSRSDTYSSSAEGVVREAA